MSVFKVQCPTCRSDDPTIHRAYQCGHSDCPCTGCSWHECEDSWHEGAVVDAPAPLQDARTFYVENHYDTEFTFADGTVDRGRICDFAEAYAAYRARRAEGL